MKRHLKKEGEVVEETKAVKKVRTQIDDYKDKYMELKSMSRGELGTACLVERRADGKEFVAKKYQVSEMTVDLRLELMTLKRLRHENLV